MAILYQPVTPVNNGTAGMKTANTSGNLLSYGKGGPWYRGFIGAVADNQGNGDLIGLLWDNTANALYLYKSTNSGVKTTGDGQTGSGNPIAVTGTVTGNPMELAISQDSVGNLHCVYANFASNNWVYMKVTLTRTSGSVTGAAAACISLNATNFPGSTFATVTYCNGRCQVIHDGSANERVMFLLTDDQSAGNNIRHQFGITSVAAGISPSVAGDFIGITGGTGGDVVQIASGASAGVTTNKTGSGATHSWGSNSGSHLYPGRFEVNPANADLYYFFGQVDGDLGNGDDGLGIQVARMPCSGTTWSLVTASVVITSPCPNVGPGQQNPPAPKLIATASTANYVWMLYSEPAHGLCIDRWDSSGTHTLRYLTPYTLTTNALGFGAWSISNDETRIWIISMMYSGFGTSPNFFGGIFYNGSTWATYGPAQTAGSNDTTTATGWADNWGLLSCKWSEGLLSIFGGEGGSDEAHTVLLSGGTTQLVNIKPSTPDPIRPSWLKDSFRDYPSTFSPPAASLPAAPPNPIKVVQPERYPVVLVDRSGYARSSGPNSQIVVVPVDPLPNPAPEKVPPPPFFDRTKVSSPLGPASQVAPFALAFEPELPEGNVRLDVRARDYTLRATPVGPASQVGPFADGWMPELPERAVPAAQLDRSAMVLPPQQQAAGAAPVVGNMSTPERAPALPLFDRTSMTQPPMLPAAPVRGSTFTPDRFPVPPTPDRSGYAAPARIIGPTAAPVVGNVVSPEKSPPPPFIDRSIGARPPAAGTVVPGSPVQPVAPERYRHAEWFVDRSQAVRPPPAGSAPIRDHRPTLFITGTPTVISITGTPNVIKITGGDQMPGEDTITMDAGDAPDIQWTYEDASGNPLSLNAVTEIHFVVRNGGAPTSPLQFEKRMTDSEITITNSAAGQAVIEIDEADTDAIVASVTGSRFFYSIQLTFNDGRRPRIVSSGLFVLKGNTIQ